METLGNMEKGLASEWEQIYISSRVTKQAENLPLDMVEYHRGLLAHGFGIVGEALIALQDLTPDEFLAILDKLQGRP